MTLQPIGTNIRIAVGAKQNLGVQTVGSFAWQFLPNYPDEVMAIRYPGEDANDAGMNKTLLCWMTLPRNGERWAIASDRKLSDFTVNSNAFVEVTPAGRRQCVKCVDTSQASSITYNTIIPDKTPWMAYCQRDASPLPDTQWSITFGDGWVLSWNLDASPVVIDKNGKKYPCKSSDVEVESYKHSTNIEWIFVEQNGDMRISSTCLRSTWIISNSVIGDGQVTVTASSGSLTLSVDTFQFANGGTENPAYIVTDYIDTGQAIPIDGDGNALDPDPCGPGTTMPRPLTTAEGGSGWYYRTYGDIAATCGATVTLYRPVGVPAIDGTKARFQLNLTGAGDIVESLSTATRTFDGSITKDGNAKVTVTATGLPQNSYFKAEQSASGGPATSSGQAFVILTVDGVYESFGITVNITDGDTSHDFNVSILAALTADSNLTNLFDITLVSDIITFTGKAKGVMYPRFNCAIQGAEGFADAPTSIIATVWESVDYAIPAKTTDSLDTLALRTAYILSQDPYLTTLYTPSTLNEAICLTANHDGTDSILNIAIDNDTCEGLTPEPTSSNGQLSQTSSSQTPMIGKFEIIRMPEFGTLGTTCWLDVMPWYDHGQASFCKVWASNQATLHFNHHLVKDDVTMTVNGTTSTLNGVTMLQALADMWTAAGYPLLNGYPVGQLAVTIDIAYIMQDTTTRAITNPDYVTDGVAGHGAWIRRMTGITQFEQQQGGMYDSNQHPYQMELRAHNRYVTFGNKMGRMCCLDGYRVDDALILIALFAGVLPTDIRYYSGVTLPIVFQPSGNVGYSTYGDLSTLILTDPGKRYYQSIWQPAPGDTADSWVQKIQQRFPNVQCQFGMDGLLYLYQQAYGAQPVGDTFNTATPNQLYALTDTTLTRDGSAMINMVTIEGATPEGNPLYASLTDTDSVSGTADNTVGAILQDWKCDTSQTTQDDVNRAVIAEYNRRKTGHACYNIGKPAWAGIFCTPGQLIGIIDASNALATTAFWDGTKSVMLLNDVNVTLGNAQSPLMVEADSATCETWFPDS
jgi:hypothetical protein